MWPTLGDPALRLGEETVTYGELLLVGAVTGLLEMAREETTRSLQVLASDLGEPGQDELQAEAVAFRRARRLESGEDLRTWLGSRQLTMADLESHLRRAIAGRSPLEPPDSPLSEQAVHHAIVVDLACSGWWRDVADDLGRYWSASFLSTGGSLSAGECAPAQPSDDVAAARDGAEQLTTLAPFGPLEAEWCASRIRVLRSRQRALDEARQRFGSDPAVSARIADHSVDWMSFTFDSLCLPNHAAAKEAAMCAQEDGLPPDEIALRSGRPLQHRQRRRNELSVATASLLAGAIAGELAGLLDSDEGVLVLWLRERRPPSADDPVARQEAAAELLAEALDRAAGGRVQAVGPL